MTAPNIEMIAALLRSCTLGRSWRQSPPAAGAIGDSVGSVAVELNSETALPFHWEQCLDMRTGEVYFVNRETGARTRKDPRTAGHASSYHSSEDVSSSGDNCSDGGGGDDYEDDSGNSGNSASSCLTSLSSTSHSEAPPAEPLVSAGCRACFMFFMVPKSDDACPKCGGGLLKLGRDGCV